MNEEQALRWLDANVSRETQHDLQIMVDELIRWNRRINLVAPSTLPHVWSRHVVDSAQLLARVPDHASNWLDLGSGAGFPGMVLGIMLKERKGASVTCVESNGKKASFLAHCARLTKAPVKVENRRIESVMGMVPDVITARALKSLPELFGFCENLCTADTILLFPKGRDSKKEVDAAKAHWQFDVDSCSSISGSEGNILRISNLGRLAA